MQPLWGQCCGRKDVSEIKWYFRSGITINLIYTVYLFSTKRTGGANMIAISRSIVVKSPAIFLMPILFGTNAIWLAPLAAETITLALTFFLNWKICIVYK